MSTNIDRLRFLIDNNNFNSKTLVDSLNRELVETEAKNKELKATIGSLINVIERLTYIESYEGIEDTMHTSIHEGNDIIDIVNPPLIAAKKVLSNDN